MDFRDKSKKTYLRIFGFVKNFWGLLFLCLGLNVIFSTFETMSIALIRPIFQILFEKKMDTPVVVQQVGFFESIKDQFYKGVESLIFSPNGMVGTLINLSALILFIFLLKNIFKYMASLVGVKVNEGIIKNIRDEIFKKLTSLSVDFFSKSRQGNIISTLTNDVATMNNSSISTFTVMLKDFTQIVLFMLLLLSISTYLTLISFSTTIVSFIVLRIAIKYLKKYASRMQSAMADFTSVLQETLFGIRIVKAYNAETTANNKFFAQTSRYVRSSVKLNRITSLVPGFNEMFAILALCVVLFVGGSQVLSGEMQGGDLMLFLFSLFSIMAPIASFTGKITGYQNGIVAADRIFTIIDAEPNVVDGTKLINSINESIEVKNLHFAYNSQSEVLNDCSLRLEKGRKIAFVGSSGSGKSTMLDLIIRFYDPSQGGIYLDGENIKDLSIKSYRSLFGVVSQETLLFNDTVANNIKYGYDNATDEEIINASKTANAYKFITNMPEGFNTSIGDRGVLLSGGERQRLAIARALIRDPQILVFDEATSALDAESEKIVQSAINDSLKNRTAIIVAHRLATIIDCDEIIVFDKGRIIERGNHQQLIAQKGIYKMLFDIQFSEPK